MNKDNTNIPIKLIINGDVKNIFINFHFYYSINGIIIKGNKIGRTIGFPTANILPVENSLIPKNGVYAVFVSINKIIYRGMLNIGVRPTFDLTNISIEVHLFDFNESIYDQEVTIHYVERIRDEIKFKSKEELIAQLQQDQIIITNVLKNYPMPS
jgi:riboflavin kinase / FMN adenylyltransferase